MEDRLIADKNVVLSAKIVSNVQGFVAGIGTAIASTKKFQASWSAFGSAATASMTRIGLAAGIMSGVIIKRFAEYERSMIRVGTITETLGTRSFKTLQDAAEEAGATTIFSATESAKAMEKLGLAGLSTSDIVGGALTSSLELAAAAQIDISTSADILAKAMRGMGLEAKDLSRVNDTLVATQSRANTGIIDLSEAMVKVAPIAKQQGIEIETLSAVLGKVADAGIVGAQAGTGLKRVFSSLAGTSDRTKTALRLMGIDAADPLVKKLRQVQAALEGATDKAAALELGTQLAGEEGVLVLFAALNQGVDAIAQFEAGLRSAAGIAQRAKDAELNSLWGQFKLITSAIDGIAIAIGKSMNPELRAMTDELQKFLALNSDKIVQGLSDAFVSMFQALKQVGTYISQNSDTLIKFGGYFRDVVKWVAKLIEKFPELGAVIAGGLVLKILGLTAVFTSLVGALTSTAALIVSWSWAPLVAGLSALGTTLASIAASATAAATGVAGIVGAITILGTKKLNDKFNWLENDKEFTDALAKRSDAVDGLLEAKADSHRRVLSEISNLDGDTRSERALLEHQKAEQDLAELESALRSASKKVDTHGLIARTFSAEYRSDLSRMEILEKKIMAKKVEAEDLFAAIHSGILAELKASTPNFLGPRPSVPMGPGPIGPAEVHPNLAMPKIPDPAEVKKKEEEAQRIKEQAAAKVEAAMQRGREQAKKHAMEVQKVRDEFNAVMDDISSKSIPGAIEVTDKLESRMKVLTTTMDAAATITADMRQEQELLMKQAQRTKSAADSHRKIRIMKAVKHGKYGKKGIEGLSDEDKAYGQEQVQQMQFDAWTKNVGQGFNNTITAMAGLTDGLEKNTEAEKNGQKSYAEIQQEAQESMQANADAMDKLQEFLGRQGVTAMLIQHNIAFLRQAQTILPRYRHRAHLEKKIVILQQQLARALKPAVPNFTASRIGFQGIVDPGLQGDGDNTSNGAIIINVNTQSKDGAGLVQDLELELQRRGRRN